MRRLADAPELLDGALGDSASLDGNLRDLRLVNRRLGGTAISIRALRALVLAARGGDGTRGADALRVLDVGTGAADIPLALVRAAGPWQSVRVTAVDSRPEIIAAAPRVSPDLDGNHAIELAVADGRSLPYGDGEFDVAHASMVLHHLEPPDAVRFLRELGRVAGVGVVLNDLARGLVPWLGAWLLLHALTRNRYTRHDGPLSVRRAYTAAEARALLQDAGLRPVAEAHALAGHRWAIAAVLR